MHTYSTPYSRISPQWLSALRQLWPSIPWWIAYELVSWQVPTLCLDSGINSPLGFRWVKGVCVFRCNLPPVLLAEWPGSFTCHCSNTGVKWTPNKSAHKVNSGEENSPTTPAAIRTCNLSITSPALYQQATPVHCLIQITQIIQPKRRWRTVWNAIIFKSVLQYHLTYISACWINSIILGISYYKECNTSQYIAPGMRSILHALIPLS